MSRNFLALFQDADLRTQAEAREVALSRTLEALHQSRQEDALLQQAIPATEKKNANSLEILCQGLSSRQRLEGAAVPAVVPKTQRPSAFFSGENLQLVRRLFLAAGDEAPRAVVFCTVEQGNARNWISARAAELLICLTQSSVCIVDADLANPSLHTYFGVENGEGLARSVLERGSVQEFARSVGPSGLRLLSAGALPPGGDSHSLLTAGRLGGGRAELRSDIDDGWVHGAVVVSARRFGAFSLAEFLSMQIAVRNFVLFAGLLLVWHSLFSFLRLYESKRISHQRIEAFDILRAASLATVALFLVGSLFSLSVNQPLFLGVFLLVSTSTGVLSRRTMRFLLEQMRLRGRNLRQILIVGTNWRARQFPKTLQATPALAFPALAF